MDQESRSRGWVYWCSLCLIGTALYVASIGPASWICGIVEDPAALITICRIVYAPVITLHSSTEGTRFDAVHDLLHRYVDWWETLAAP